MLTLFRKAGFNPDQPRVPAGSREGGRWTDGGGGDGDVPTVPVFIEQPQHTIYDPPLEPVYPEFFIVPLLRVGRLATAWRAWLQASAASRNWQLSPTKSALKWRNRPGGRQNRYRTDAERGERGARPHQDPRGGPQMDLGDADAGIVPGDLG
jgi:hypothetical protein